MIFGTTRQSHDLRRSAREMKTQATIIVLALVACAVWGCRQREEQIWDPLVFKYFHFGPVILNRSENKTFFLDYTKDPPARRVFSFRDSHIPTNSVDIHAREYPEFTSLLRTNGIVITNAITALDVRNLAAIALSPFFPTEYLVENVTLRNAQWVLEERYWGSPDDAHRVPSKIIHRLHVDPDGLFTNMTTLYYPRQMDMESQNNSVEDIGAKRAESSR